MNSVEKTMLRQQARERRLVLPMVELSRQIIDVLAAWPAFIQAKTVLSYVALLDEVNLMPLIEQHPEKRWALPRIKGPGTMQFYDYCPSDALEVGPMNILQPKADALRWEASDDATLLLVPALMLDRQGYRLGYGGGFYDRFLMSHPIPAACVLPNALWVEDLPKDKWDIPVKWGVDEIQVIDF